MKIPLTDFSGGVNYDQQDYECPVNQFTDVSNVTFRDGRCQKAKGYTEVYVTPTIRPQALFYYKDAEDSSVHWIYPGITDGDVGKIYSVNGVVETDRTRVSSNYAPDDLIPWTGGALNGLFVVNNGIDIPQKWDRTTGSLNAKFEDLANWPANTTARVIRPFRNFLIAMDITDTGNNPDRNPYRVMWSDAADPYTEPSTWVAAASNLAGDLYLSEGSDYVIDGAPLRGDFVVYKEQSTHILRFVGGNTVFTHDRLFNEHGILAARCVAPFGDGLHFVVTKGDVIVHDGNTVKSVADNLVRKKIFSDIDTEKYVMSFCTPYYQQEEIWFCYPTTGADYAGRAAIWNYKTGAWTFRSLPRVPDIAFGIAETASLNDWDSDTGTWDADTGTWDTTIYNPSSYDLVMISRGATDTAANARFMQVDSSNTRNGENMTCFAKKTGIDGGDPTTVKHISQLHPKLHGGPVKFRTGGAMSQTGQYTWGPYTEYNPGDGQYKVDSRTTGRYLGFELYSDQDVDWGLDSIVFEVTEVGNR